MGISMRAALKESSAKVVHKYLSEESDVQRLKNVAGSMTFHADTGFMDFESREHKYMPFLHLVGYVKGVSCVGDNFPYGVSDLTFSENDANKAACEVLYYPTPDELAHIIKDCHFYTDKFELPRILTSNDYEFPCLLDMDILPPENEAAYFAKSGQLLEQDGTDKLNLPLFYVSIKGSGVSKENDRLLAYYGIEFEQNYVTFGHTSESSGYGVGEGSKPLLFYVKSPTMSLEDEIDSKQMAAVTDFEDAMKDEQMQSDTQVSVEMAGESYEDEAEIDPAVYQMAQNVHRAMSSKFGPRLSLETVREQNRLNAEENKLTQPDVPERRADVKMDVGSERNAYVEQARKEALEHAPAESVADKDFFETAQLEGSDVQDARAQSKVEEAHAEALAKEAALTDRQMDSEHDALVADVETAAAGGKQLKQPVEPQQMAEVKMDLSPEANRYVEEQRETAGKKNADSVLPQDRTDVEHMVGADVKDTREQAKVDEAHARDLARDTSVDVAQKRQLPDVQPSDKHHRADQEAAFGG